MNNPLLRNGLALAFGLMVTFGGNMAIIIAMGNIIPLPEGVTMENLKDSMHLLEAKHYVTPYLAHGLPTLLGAWLAASIAVSNRLLFAMIIGGLHMAGGIANAIMLDFSWLVSITDITLMYIPMAYIGYMIGRPKK